MKKREIKKGSVRVNGSVFFIANDRVPTQDLDYEYEEIWECCFEDAEYAESEYSRYGNQRIRRSSLHGE